MSIVRFSTMCGVSSWNCAGPDDRKIAARSRWSALHAAARSKRKSYRPGRAEAALRGWVSMEACIITDHRQWDDFIASSLCCNITQSFEWGQLGRWRGDEAALPIGVID